MILMLSLISVFVACSTNCPGILNLVFVFVACSISCPDLYFNLAKLQTHKNIIHDYFFLLFTERNITFFMFCLKRLKEI